MYLSYSETCQNLKMDLAFCTLPPRAWCFISYFYPSSSPIIWRWRIRCRQSAWSTMLVLIVADRFGTGPSSYISALEILITAKAPHPQTASGMREQPDGWFHWGFKTKQKSCKYLAQRVIPHCDFLKQRRERKPTWAHYKLTFNSAVFSEHSRYKKSYVTVIWLLITWY